MTASFEGHFDIVRILIEAQAQVNTQKEVCCYKITNMYICTLQLRLFYVHQDGVAALHMAAQEGKVDVVRLLIDAGAQVNIQTKVHTL